MHSERTTYLDGDEPQGCFALSGSLSFSLIMLMGTSGENASGSSLIQQNGFALIPESCRDSATENVSVLEAQGHVIAEYL